MSLRVDYDERAIGQAGRIPDAPMAGSFPYWSPDLRAPNDFRVLDTLTNAPQWSPPSTGGSSRPVFVVEFPVEPPQWSPPLTGGRTRTGASGSRQASNCRNGARR